MREIKFRAWDRNTKEWCAIDMAYADDRQGPISKPVVFDGRGKCVIQQYTGLKDKNGVEIYEGDILRIGSSLIEEVKWVGVGDWVGAKQPMVGFISYETIYPKPIEVIGNIYENHELLKGVK